MASSHFGFAKLMSINGDEFYIKSPTLILGRSSKSEKSYNFCSLSNSKQISRQHAQIFFNFKTVEFQILCICKNDIFVDKKIVSMEDGPVNLKHGSTIVIGDFVLLFVLPENFLEQFEQYKFSEFFHIKFDDDTSGSKQCKPSNPIARKNSVDKPKEKLLNIVKMAIADSVNQKLTFEEIVSSIEKRYTGKYPDWISNANWKNGLRNILNNKRQFYQFNERHSDAKKRPVFVEYFTLKKLAEKVVPDELKKNMTNQKFNGLVNLKKKTEPHKNPITYSMENLYRNMAKNNPFAPKNFRNKPRPVSSNAHLNFGALSGKIYSPLEGENIEGKPHSSNQRGFSGEISGMNFLYNIPQLGVQAKPPGQPYPQAYMHGLSRGFGPLGRGFGSRAQARSAGACRPSQMQMRSLVHPLSPSANARHSLEQIRLARSLSATPPQRMAFADNLRMNAIKMDPGRSGREANAKQMNFQGKKSLAGGNLADYLSLGKHLQKSECNPSSQNTSLYDSERNLEIRKIFGEN